MIRPLLIWSGMCERCQSKSWSRSRRRNLIERIAGFALVPYRCNLCDARFFRLRFVGEQQNRNTGGAEAS
jgi:hypothetical protein